MGSVGESMEGVGDSMGSVAESMVGVGDPMGSVAKSMEAVAESMESVRECMGAVADFMLSVANPMVSVADPVVCVVNPMEVEGLSGSGCPYPWHGVDVLIVPLVLAARDLRAYALCLGLKPQATTVSSSGRSTTLPQGWGLALLARRATHRVAWGFNPREDPKDFKDSKDGRAMIPAVVVLVVVAVLLVLESLPRRPLS
jgi:hypothetical protein